MVDIAQSYNPAEYEASVFLDHIRWYGTYGKVLATKIAEDDKGRTTLYLQIDPTPDLLQLNQNHQFKYPSLGINTNFQGSGKAYLDHLGAVTQPASVATQPMQFSHGNGDLVELQCFACADPVALDLEPESTLDADAPNWFKRFLTQFSQPPEEDEMSKAALEALQQQVEQFTSELTDLKSKMPGAGSQEPPADLEERFTALEAAMAKLDTSSDDDDDTTDKFKALEDKLAEFGQKLTDALAEDPGTQTPAHQGSGESEFSMV